LVLGGAGHNSHISVIKKGITIQTREKLEGLPSLMPNGLFKFGDKLGMRFFDTD